jgi:hypothetical protein
MEINFPQSKMVCSLTVKYKMERIIQEMLAIVYWPVTMVNNQEISRNGFLNKLICNLVIYLGMATRFSKNSGRRSRLLSCFFKKSMQSSPLEVNIGSGSLIILRNT